MRITFEFVPEGQCETKTTLMQYEPSGSCVIVVNEDWYSALSHEARGRVLHHEAEHARTWARLCERRKEQAEHQLALDLSDADRFNEALDRQINEDVWRTNCAIG